MVYVPGRIQIGPNAFAVNSDSERMRSAELAGQIDYHTHRIFYTYENQDAQAVRDTILHEVLHGILDFTNLKKVLGNDCEDVICRLAPALLDTLRRNPDFVAFLMDGVA